jgi:hypothetical protein
LISYYVFCQRVDNEYYSSLERASKACASNFSPEEMMYFWKSINTEEYRKLREQAAEAGDEKIIEEWMLSKPGYFLDDGFVSEVAEESEDTVQNQEEDQTDGLTAGDVPDEGHLPHHRQGRKARRHVPLGRTFPVKVHALHTQQLRHGLHLVHPRGFLTADPAGHSRSADPQLLGQLSLAHAGAAQECGQVFSDHFFCVHDDPPVLRFFAQSKLPVNFRQNRPSTQITSAAAKKLPTVSPRAQTGRCP